MDSSITIDRDQRAIRIIDQNYLPYETRNCYLDHVDQVITAIRRMQVRGAPLIGISAAFGLAMAVGENADDAHIAHNVLQLKAARPTAVNLQWAVDYVHVELKTLPLDVRAERAWQLAEALLDDDKQRCQAIGEHLLRCVLELNPRLVESKKIRMMTHCNTGCLATGGRGTALSLVHQAAQAGYDVHVWVSETRPRNQGLLTAWELEQFNVPYRYLVDNAAGLILAEQMVDVVIVGADRIARNGDTANKIGTYLKSLAACDQAIPFIVAAPTSTIDLNCPDGQAITIETRHVKEVARIKGRLSDETLGEVSICPPTMVITNPAFDITPARLITKIVTEKGSYNPEEIGQDFVV